MDIHSSCRVSCVWRFPPFMLLRMSSTLQLWPYRNRHTKNPAYGHSPICIQVLRFRCRLQGTLYMMWSFYYCCSVAKFFYLGRFILHVDAKESLLKEIFVSIKWRPPCVHPVGYSQALGLLIGKCGKSGGEDLRTGGVPLILLALLFGGTSVWMLLPFEITLWNLKVYTACRPTMSILQNAKETLENLALVCKSLTF